MVHGPHRVLSIHHDLEPNISHLALPVSQCIKPQKFLEKKRPEILNPSENFSSLKLIMPICFSSLKFLLSKFCKQCSIKMIFKFVTNP